MDFEHVLQASRGSCDEYVGFFSDADLVTGGVEGGMFLVSM